VREWKCINFNNNCPVAVSAQVLSHPDHVALPSCPACRAAMVEVATIIRARRLRRGARRWGSLVAVLIAIGVVAWFVIPHTPWIYSAGQVSGMLGKPFEYQIKAVLAPTQYGIEWPTTATSSDLPWASVDPTRGLVTGQPSRPGVVRLTITATNRFGTTRKTLRIDVDSTPVQVTSPDQADAIAGEAFHFTIQASPKPSGFTCPSLPPWLILDQTSGEIKGTPPNEGTFTLPMRVDTPAGAAAQTITLHVIAANKQPPRLLPIAPFDGETETRVSMRVACDPATGVQFAADGLPDGLSINPADGQISGIPTRAGDFTATVRAKNAVAQTQGQAVFHLVAVARVPVVEAGQEIKGFVDGEISLKLRATHSPDMFELAPLSPGISLDAKTGTVSGKPEKTVKKSQASLRAHNAQGWSTPVSVTIEIALDPKDVQRAQEVIHLSLEQVGIMAEWQFLLKRVQQRAQTEPNPDPDELEMARRRMQMRDSAARSLVSLLQQARQLPPEAIDQARHDFAQGKIDNPDKWAVPFKWLDQHWDQMTANGDALKFAGELEQLGRSRAAEKALPVN